MILAGLDLCMRDISSHARPNAFERLLQRQGTRTAPFYSLSFRRSADQEAIRIGGESAARSSRSLRTYAGWFSRNAAPGTGRVFRLFPSPVELPGMTMLDAASLRELVGTVPTLDPGTHFSASQRFPPREARRTIILRALDTWLDDVSAGIAKAEGAEGYRALALRPSLFQLAYDIETQLFLETKRKEELRFDGIGELEERGPRGQRPVAFRAPRPHRTRRDVFQPRMQNAQHGGLSRLP